MNPSNANLHLRPRYQVGPVEEVERPVHTLASRKGKEDAKTVKRKMVTVYFPQGHSTRMTVERARELGYFEPAKIVDMESGMEVPVDVHDLRSFVAQRTRNRSELMSMPQQASVDQLAEVEQLADIANEEDN